MPKSIVLLIISLSTLLLLGGWWVQQPALHVGVIRMEKLVYDYAGMKDATKAYTGQLATWNAEVDSLGKEIQALRAAPGTSAGGDKQSRLARLEGNYQALQQQFNERANSEDHTMTGGIVAQLNEHIRTYAEEKGYDLILLQTPDVPNVGYAGKRVDITEQVLEYANRKYNYGH